MSYSPERYQRGLHWLGHGNVEDDVQHRSSPHLRYIEAKRRTFGPRALRRHCLHQKGTGYQFQKLGRLLWCYFSRGRGLGRGRGRNAFIPIDLKNTYDIWFLLTPRMLLHIFFLLWHTHTHHHRHSFDHQSTYSTPLSHGYSRSSRTSKRFSCTHLRPTKVPVLWRPCSKSWACHRRRHSQHLFIRTAAAAA
jgi:hypothetical protein